MAIINTDCALTARFFHPVASLLEHCPSTRACPSLDDSNWIGLGVHRCLQSSSSGRGFLQSFRALMPELCPRLSHFF